VRFGRGKLPILVVRRGPDTGIVVAMTNAMTGTRAERLGEDRWIRRFHPRPGCAVRLLCLPHAGGSSSFFHSMSAALPPEIEVLAAQYPGRQDRHAEPNVGDLAELADHVFTAIRPHAGEPLAVFGHSMGAVLGYEVALRLQDAGLPTPVRLFASGRRAPSLHRLEKLHAADDATVVAELRLLSGPQAAFLDPEVLAMSMASIRADYHAVETYRHEPGRRLNCPITVLTGAQDPRVPVEEVRGWAEHTTADADVRVYPGGHFFLVDQSAPIRALIAGQLLGSGPDAGRR
jgi:surfactin synthase thioesterase subunit